LALLGASNVIAADTWTGCYHQGRAMLNVSDRLRQLAAMSGP
jgi:hypothetical protein